jgi:hypothetical protein
MNVDLTVNNVFAALDVDVSRRKLNLRSASHGWRSFARSTDRVNVDVELYLGTTRIDDPRIAYGFVALLVNKW